MSSGDQADPGELNLPEMSDEAWLESGPLIDSSEEFPLPSLDGELAPGAEGLFPIEVSEPTAEEMTPVERFPGVVGTSEAPNLSSALDDEFALPSIEEEVKPSSPVGVESPPKSEDADYFEAGLEEEQVMTPPPAPQMRVAVPAPPVPAPPVPKAPVPKAPAPSAPAFKLPPKVEAPALPDLDAALESARGRQTLTQPGAPQASVTTAPTTVTAPSAPKAPPVVAEPPPEPAEPESSIDEIFFDGEEPSPKVEPEPRKVSRDDWAEVPVDQYVRKAEIKRKSTKNKKVRPWVPILGLAVVGLAFAFSKPLFTDMHAVEVSDPVLVVASQPAAEVFDGDTSLGETPLSLKADLATKQLEIRKTGFETIAVTPWDPKLKDGPVQKFVRPLQVSPVALSWAELGQDAEVWWNGSKTDPRSLAEVQPGDYQLKVKPALRPAVSLPIKVEAGKPLAVDALVKAELAKQPEVKLGLKMPGDKGEAKDLAFKIKSVDQKAVFSADLKVSTGQTSDLVLPGPGKYKISFAGDSKFKAANQTVELVTGASESVMVALAKVPPKPVAQPVSRPTYRPSAPVYRPAYRPPRRYNGGGGGGGGRIAPPAF